LATAQAGADGGLLAVALDGKTLRGARRMGGAATHLVSVFAHHARLVLGQLAVSEKSNEIPCVRELLRLFRNQVRLLVTVDAMHTQIATAKMICSTLKSHYLMIVKSNQPKLAARIQALPWAQVPVNAADEHHGHGRDERRTLKVLTTTRGIGFPYAKQVIEITRERVITATGEHSREIVYAICSLPFERARPAMISAWIRQHWGIENAVHYVRDVTLAEDASMIRTGTAPHHRSWPA
jgi:predicted transposase YbfD/YdcC